MKRHSATLLIRERDVDPIACHHFECVHPQTWRVVVHKAGSEKSDLCGGFVFGVFPRRTKPGSKGFSMERWKLLVFVNS